jgi:hypothetical protein
MAAPASSKPVVAAKAAPAAAPAAPKPATRLTAKPAPDARKTASL